MIAKVPVNVQVLVELHLIQGVGSTLDDIKAEAKAAAIELVKVGVFHANRELKDYNKPRIANEGRDVPVSSLSVGMITIIDK